ncbi:hypothetical protein SAMN04489761_0836 [Tenacibaculum sp. MAR_2009_124]|uniref:hypothetical protein n=1 Tax=Tenacibaculum sp. MAR_2009_124 TaxID=1250059 RepID=UPI0008989DAC|nr:hypothetical protein [Tenacibaculum sp. MAR_2009_124]SEB45805.1 hypothetical protein SAMN04489761_0836 [Tenacibaculum sp. MAR_2009_124]
MNTKKTFIIGFIFLNLLLISCGSSKQIAYSVTSYDQNKQSTSTVYDDTNKLGYTITKDNSHLYVTVTTRDRGTQVKMLRNGVTILFDNDGKKNNNISVQYPVVKENKPLDIEKIKKMREQGNQQEMLQTIMTSLGTDISISESEGDRIINKELNSEGISVNHKIALEGLYYTLKVPLSYIASPSSTKSIGISIKGMKKPDGSNGTLPMGAKSSGRIKRALAMRGGMKGNNIDINQLKEMLTNINIWIPIKLK